MADSFTLTITGIGPGDRRATESEAMRMAIYLRMVEARTEAAGRCGTCAFSPGTAAHGSSLVVRCIDHTLMSGGSFLCPENEDQECAGFSAIKNEFTPPIDRPIGPPNRIIVEGRQPA